jgi:uncharacterized protein YkwD
VTSERRRPAEAGRLFLVIIAFASLFAAAAYPTKAAAEEGGIDYRALNERETRYVEYKDSEEMLQAKLTELSLINEERVKNGSPALALDILASRVANRMAKEACAGNFSGHWNMRGEKPYYRYAVAGGVDHVSENAAATWSSGTLGTDTATCRSLMKESHERFMAERPPSDGHRANCLEKSHNFVGLGAFVMGGQFRYYEEYLDRYLDFLSAPSELAVNQKAAISVRPRDRGMHLYAIVIYRETLPKPMSAQEINARGGYPDYTNEQVRALWPWELAKITVGGLTSLETSFPREGLYYVQIYLDSVPYTGGSATTNGKTQASGLVIRVR